LGDVSGDTGFSSTEATDDLPTGPATAGTAAEPGRLPTAAGPRQRLLPAAGGRPVRASRGRWGGPVSAHGLVSAAAVGRRRRQELLRFAVRLQLPQFRHPA